MRTTLNIPDGLATAAKRRAIDESTTLTDLIVQGLTARLQKSPFKFEIPVSKSRGGLQQGIGWDFHQLDNARDQWYR